MHQVGACTKWGNLLCQTNPVLLLAGLVSFLREWIADIFISYIGNLCKFLTESFSYC